MITLRLSHSTFIHPQCEEVNLVQIETKIPSQKGSNHYRIEYRLSDRKLNHLVTIGLKKVRGSIYCLFRAERKSRNLNKCVS